MVGGSRNVHDTKHCLFDHITFVLQLTQCPQPLQVLRQRQLSNPGGIQLSGPSNGNSLYGSSSGSGNPITSSASWPTNPIHIKQEIQIPQVRLCYFLNVSENNVLLILQVSSLTSSPDSSPSPGMMSANINLQSGPGHISSPQQQSVTQLQLQQQQQQQQQHDPTKSIQWQISTSTSSGQGQNQHQQNINKV